MGVNLKPCPCCGQPAQIDDPEAHRRACGFRVECEPCNLSMWSFRGETPDQLAARWK